MHPVTVVAKFKDHFRPVTNTNAGDTPLGAFFVAHLDAYGPRHPYFMTYDSYPSVQPSVPPKLNEYVNEPAQTRAKPCSDSAPQLDTVASLPSLEPDFKDVIIMMGFRRKIQCPTPQ
jgi:hypothetical protein